MKICWAGFQQICQQSKDNEESLRLVLISETGYEINASSPTTKTPSPLVKFVCRRKIKEEIWKEHTITASDKTILVCLHACKSVSWHTFLRILRELADYL